ncbi:MAG: hypothetical protein PHY05_12375 [Methanothrix sp.]|nr:hypothetical protein [Methanothrix sp.]
MKLITDDSNADLAALFGIIRTLAPELWGSGQRSLLLPRELGDLVRPEYLEQIKGKIKKMKQLHDLFDAGLLTRDQYLSRKGNIISEM